MGVFRHGDTVRELELMAEDGMPVPAVLRAVEEDPTRDLGALRRVRLVVQGGRVVR